MLKHPRITPLTGDLSYCIEGKFQGTLVFQSTGHCLVAIKAIQLFSGTKVDPIIENLIKVYLFSFPIICRTLQSDHYAGSYVSLNIIL